jgi:cyclophilin family peptidyl-prolyl cis-trans isomerase
VCAIACSAIGCSHRRSPPPTGPAADAETAQSSPPSDILATIVRAEDRRRIDELPRDAQSSLDVAVRRAAARALARILDPDDTPLLRALDDEDDEVVAWASYGLGESCNGREDRHVRALAARLVSLSEEADLPDSGPSAGQRALGRSARSTLLRALGRCGGDLAETTLRAALSAGGMASEAAAYALGDTSARKGSVSDETAVALLDAARATTPLDAALFPFGHLEARMSPELWPRLAAAARSALGRPGPHRLFAIRALGRTDDPDAGADLARVLLSDQATPAERVEAARALSRGSVARKLALADAFASMVGSWAEPWVGDRFAVLLSAMGDLDVGVPERTETSLWALARAKPDRGADPAVIRRVSALRCGAAAHLARHGWDADILRQCDLGDGEAGERARLAAIDFGTMDRARRAAWSEIARSAHLRVREASIEAIVGHPELSDAARSAIASALATEEPGLVATAAKLLQSHPERMFTSAVREAGGSADAAARAVANPNALDPGIARALGVALARSWRMDLVETREALIDAAIASGSGEGRTYALKSCTDPSPTVRSHAAKALVVAGFGPKGCDAATTAFEPAAELAHELSSPTRVVLNADAGSVSITFDPVLAPVAATRLVALARSGFYTGVSFHRVVPGFVVQFGDRGGDGYGGSGDLLRCETSPVPFEPFDVGVALAGRDTGSSQLFVTLARYPHLDGQYAWVGNAVGDWDAIAEGDVIRSVHVED